MDIFFFVLSFPFYLFNVANNKFLIQGQTFKLKSWIGWKLRISSLKALSRTSLNRVPKLKKFKVHVS